MGAISAAFHAIPRVGFLPPTQAPRAGFDGPLGIGHGQTNSQPSTVADMLELLAVEPGQHVLDVGCGSGWTTALLAHLVGPSGRVRGVELEPELVAFGRGNLAATRQPWATIEQADPDVLGLPQHAPYDRILVSAQAGSLPTTLVEQLAESGTMVIPVAGVMTRVELPGPNITEHGRYRFVPLR